MRGTIIIFFAISALYVSARVIKRQKKITRVLKPACQQSVLELPSPKSLLEAAHSCFGSCGCPSGPDHIYLEDTPCFVCNSDVNRIQNAEVSTCDRMAAIRLPKTIDVGVPVPANLPTLCQSDIPSCQCQCQCQNARPYIFDSPCGCNCEFMNPIDVSIPRIPVETIIQTVIVEAPRSVKIPSCGCQIPVQCCQRQKCGCQLSALDVPCSCQMPAIRKSCGCTLSAFDFPCGCQLPPFNLPCGCQLPEIDCGCRFQAFNSPCGCEMASGSCGCQLPETNVPYAYQLSALDVPCGYQVDPCGCQLPSCSCQLMAPAAVGCSKYLRQVTLQPPFL